MQRRDSILALAGLCIAVLPGTARTQATRRDSPARIAILDDAPEEVRASLWALFRKRLAERGYTEGRNVVIAARSAQGDLARLPALAAELVAGRPDVIVTVTTTVALAMKKATSEIPIIALGPADPVKSGLVASLARPGGNVTGFAPNQAEVAGKWLDLLREIVPRPKAVAYLTDPGNPGEMLVFRELEERARPLGLQVAVLDGVSARSVDQAFAVIERNRTDALIVATTASLLVHRQRIVDSAARLRLPAIYARSEYAEGGGLLSYGADLGALFPRAAEYVERILQGARPAELPFEMAATYRLVVNARTARSLGLKIPQAVLVRADQVID